MIIQCEQCQTKFKLDDSKVADKSIKVRCARCRHVFSVAGTRSVPADSAPLAPNVPEFRIEEDLVPAEAAPLDSFSFAADKERTAAIPPASDDSDFPLPSLDSTVSHDHPKTEHDADAFDFGTVEFDDVNETVEPAGAAPASDFGDDAEKEGHTASSSKDSGESDFSGDGMFGDVTSTHQETEASEPISFDMEMDGSADSMGVAGGAAGQGSPRAAQDLLFAPLAKAELDFTTGTIEKTAPATAQEEPPPLSIGSRRKDSPRKSAMLVFLGIVIAGLAVFYSYWGGYMTLTENKHVVPQETGQITVRSLEASFIKNNTAGDLLVISGEAVNTYDKPRAAIQIKGIVYGAKGEEVSSKSVFCGNSLSKEQLSTMTMDKIEATMANQFGDSLKNMEVAPGNAIPFVIVIPKPPAGATDYGVVPVGSTVATGIKEK